MIRLFTRTGERAAHLHGNANGSIDDRASWDELEDNRGASGGHRSRTIHLNCTVALLSKSLNGCTSGPSNLNPQEPFCWAAATSQKLAWWSADAEGAPQWTRRKPETDRRRVGALSTCLPLF